MPLDSYATLQASIASWLNREDLTSMIPDFITLAEARFNRDLRTPDMTKRATSTLTSSYVDLPTDWLQTIAVRVTSSTGYQALEYLSAELFYDLEGAQPTGVARKYTLVNNRIHLIPDGTDATLEMTYFAKITPLSGTTTSNWLLVRSPDLYLYSSLVAAEAYLMNDERLAVWKSAADQIIADMKLEGERAARPSGTLLQRKRSFG
jgi:hypothetical protein